MPQLIVGHTDRSSTRIWVRGDVAGACDVTVSSKDATFTPMTQRVEVSEQTDNTGIVVFGGLTPDHEYEVRASFSSQPGEDIAGRVRTLPSDDRGSFSFVLSSCNLSVISINNFLAFLLAAGGTKAALSSLDPPFDRWLWPSWRWIRPLLAWLLNGALKLTAGGVQKTTGLKQHDSLLLRSPFLKLSAVFESWVLEVELSEGAPASAAGDVLIAPGDRLEAGGATGVVASSPTWLDDSPDEDARPAQAVSDWRSKGSGGRTCQIVVAQVSGTFAIGQDVSIHRAVAAKGSKNSLGTIRSAAPGKAWHDPPTFFIHAGDQIYYDFPDEGRPPDKREYRMAYREAWLDDETTCHLLSHWPHYMIFDDHEFSDQFARNFNPPPPKSGASPSSADDYLREALAAYDEYVDGRNPAQSGPASGQKRYWYEFSVGKAHFFVLDTRTQRFNKTEAHSRPQMIDRDQMDRLLEWMTSHRTDLKFVVTSVPFVAEVKEFNAHPDPGANWFAKVNQPPRNKANDKWSAEDFKAQRDEIIDYIANERVERLVFLTGDMHCCYHASMRITKKGQLAYEGSTVHELAGGPINQLQLAEAEDFKGRCTKRTSRGHTYDIVLDRFHSEANAVVHIRVDYPVREQVTPPGGAGPTPTPEITWNVIRTLTDSGAGAWEEAIQTQRVRPPDPDVRHGEPVMAGRITFVTARTSEELFPWEPSSLQGIDLAAIQSPSIRK